MCEITFYYPNQQDIVALDGLSLDRDWSFFNCGRRIWILQTFIEIEKAVHGLRLSATAPASGVVVLHSDDFYSFWHSCTAPKDVFLVVVRADRSPNLYANIEITQNGFSRSDLRCRFVPHWPQPGLVIRDSCRGDLVDVVSYRGATEMLHPDLLSSSWAEALGALGLKWDCGAAVFHGADTRIDSLAWPDYRQVDVVLAIRPAATTDYPEKPASKLINGWLAGIPCILGREHAYRELRQAPEDYLEAVSPQDALELLGRLKTDPQLFRTMRARATQRATAFTRVSTRKRWIDLMTIDIPGEYQKWRRSARKHLPLTLRRALARVTIPRAALYEV